MDFRRIPFQFSSTDAAKRQAEIQKRFGLPTKQDEMFIDLANPGLMGPRKESNSASSSPRLQHRVPIFVDGMPDKSSADPNPTNVDADHKPRVRIVPIEIENSDSSTRHRTLSGSSGVNGSSYHQGPWLFDDMKAQRSRLLDDAQPKKEQTSFKSANGPKVCNIPVKIEGSDKNKRAKAGTPEKNVPSPKVTPVQKQNGCNVTKVGKSEGKKVPLSPVFQASLKKIDVVLEKLKTFQLNVAEFSGTGKQKEYRYLDEMLTRLMLDLDNIETFGSEDVRLARKAAIKKVQNSIDLLESKVTENSRNQMEDNVEVPDKAFEAGKESEILETVSVDQTVNDSHKIIDSIVGVPDVEMEDPLTHVKEPEAVEMSESQPVQMMESEESQMNSIAGDKLMSVQEQSLETHAENVGGIAGDEPCSKKGKDDIDSCSKSSSIITSSSIELPSDLVKHNEHSMKETNPAAAEQNKMLCKNISGLESNSQLETEPAQHSSVSVIAGQELNDCKKPVENVEVTDSNATVIDQLSMMNSES